MRYGVPLGPLAVQIVDTIARAGNNGISSTELFDAIYRDRRGATIDRLKSYIGSINAMLAKRGVAIRVDRYSNVVTMSMRRSA
jgi:aminoglycoside phosphotransferase (APT) family kinase protein